MENVLEYNKWEDKLWALYDSIFKDASYKITDGVIFPDKYASTPFKVMIMNREAYDEDHSSYSLNQDGIAKEIGEGIIPFKKQKTLRCRLRQYLSLIHLLSKKGFNEVSEKEELEPLVSRRIIKSQNRLFTRVLRFRAFGEIPRNTTK